MSLAEKIDSLEERERQLLFIFVGVLALMLLVLIPFLLRLSVSEQAEENERLRELIGAIDDERLTLGRRKAESERVEARYKRKAPALASFLASTADALEVEIPETQDRSTTPHGKKFKERLTHIRLNNIGLLKLSNFMDKIENSGYPLSISKLRIRKSNNKDDQYDAEMDISAFDREEKKSKSSASEDEE
ncbi:MAG: type II secretion system protein M [Polyangiaceae bacterium]|nr:type II secretion system protein M [Polyangiaceae bacterium]